MKIEVDVKRIDQSWSFDTGVHQNYFIFDFFGTEVRVPCSAEQVAEAIGTFSGVEPDAEEDEILVDAPDEPVKAVTAVSTFAGAPVDDELPPPKAAPTFKERKLQPVKREKGDDAGIAQG